MDSFILFFSVYFFSELEVSHVLFQASYLLYSLGALGATNHKMKKNPFLPSSVLY